MSDAPVQADAPPIRARKVVRVALLLYVALIFTLTHVPRAPQVPLDQGDKLAHFGAYAILAFVLRLDQRLYGRTSAAWGALLLVIIALYGAFDELLQIPVGRTADVWDWYADMLGAIVGLAAMDLLAKLGLLRRRQR